MISSDKIIVALDTSDEKKLKNLFIALEGHKVWVKIGMEIFYSLGPKVIHEAKEKGFKIFLDLKLHDIPNTASLGIRALSSLPVDMLNVHAAGGKEMMVRSAEVLKSLPSRPLLIAVTQLTSTTREQMNLEQNIHGTVEESVLNYARLAFESGLDGVVSSPLEVTAIKSLLGQQFLTVTPGIRPTGGDLNDQKRVMTPQEALSIGTDYMVIGRPITTQENPRMALENILKGN